MYSSNRTESRAGGGGGVLCDVPVISQRVPKSHERHRLCRDLTLKVDLVRSTYRALNSSQLHIEFQRESCVALLPGAR